MMKKGIKKTLTMTMAAAVIVGSALAATPVTVEAADPPVINDGCARPVGPGAGTGGSCRIPSDSDSDDENTVTEDLGRQEASTFNAGSGAGSGDNGGSTNEGGNSYSAPANDGGSTGSADYAGGSYDAGTSNGGQASASAPTGLALKGSTVSVPGYETWRQVAGAADGRFSVYHCGTEQYTLQLKDAEGKAVSYKIAALLQTEDGGWYINLATAGGVDTTGWTAGTVKGTAAYLPKLGISGVAVNGTAVVDAAN